MSRTLQHLASPYHGQVQLVSIKQGTSVIKFDTSSNANDFKRRYVNYRIRDRPINIHFYNQFRQRSRSRGGMTGGLRNPVTNFMRSRTFSGKQKSIDPKTVKKPFIWRVWSKRKTPVRRRHKKIFFSGECCKWGAEGEGDLQWAQDGGGVSCHEKADHGVKTQGHEWVKHCCQLWGRWKVIVEFVGFFFLH